MAARIDASVHCLSCLTAKPTSYVVDALFYTFFSYCWPVLYHSKMFLSIQATYPVLSLYTSVDRDIIIIRHIKLTNKTYQSLLRYYFSVELKISQGSEGPEVRLEFY